MKANFDAILELLTPLFNNYKPIVNKYRPMLNNYVPKNIRLVNAALFFIITVIYFTYSNAGSIRKLARFESHTLTIYDQNIRVATHQPGDRELPWNDRKHGIVNSILVNTFSSDLAVVTLQEVLYNQVEDLLTLLNRGEKLWSYAGIGRTDGVQDGEHVPIFYKNSHFRLIDSGSFWLSENPDTPSKGWDAGRPRITTWVKLESLIDNTFINVYNTHLDHLGTQARLESVKLITERVELNSKGINFITGDFNSRENEEPYKYMTEHFKDARQSSHVQYGHKHTATGFTDSTESMTIDFIFIDKRLPSVQVFGVLPNKFDDILYSDHRPLIIEAQFDKL